MTQQSILHLAKQGDVKAIAYVLNFLLKEKGITAKASLKDDCLRVMLESSKIPEQQSSVALIHQAMMKLDVKSIKYLKVYGKQTEHNFTAWNESLDLTYPLENSNTKSNWNAITKLWPVWIPYPSSWFRAFILVPIIAFPGASLILIIIGFGGITVSALTNSPVYLILFTIIGFFLPAVILSLTYHLVWFRWQKPKTLTTLFNFWRDSNSLWEGLYATFVIGFSSFFVIAIIATLLFFTCNSEYGGYEELLARCMGRGIGTTARVIFYNLNNFDEWNNDRFKIWFEIWLITAAYLYQVEFLIRRHFNPQQLAKGLLMCILALWTTQVIYLSSKTFSELPQNFVPIASQTPITQPSISIEVTTPSTPSQNELPSSTSIENSSSPNLSEQPLPVISPTSETSPKPIISNPLLPTSSVTTALTTSNVASQTKTLPPDLFREAVNKAMSAANFAQSSKSKNDWNEVASLWQEAITFMKAVPASHTNYKIAQKKVIEYQRNLHYAISTARLAK